MKKASIKTSILIPVLSVLIVGVVLMVLVIGMVVSSSTSDMTDNLVSARVNEYTNEFKAISNKGYAVVSALAAVVDDLSQTSENPREDIVKTLEEVLLTDDQAIGVWTCWEPDALDGKDGEFKGANEYHDESGRFVPYVFKSANGIAQEPLLDYDDPVAGLFYQGARTSGRPYITDPYVYPVDGAELNVYSITIPIIRDGAVAGAVGIDIDLADIVETMNAGSILDDGYLAIISPGGLIASHRNTSVLLSEYKSNWMKVFESKIEPILAGGGSFTGAGFSDVSNEDVQLLISGVMIGDTGRYWGVCGLVPRKTATATTNSLIMLVISMGLALIVIVGVMILILIGRSLKKLPGITSMADRVAVGDVNFDNLDSGKTPTKNEITLLERSFAAIAGSIKAQTGAMEKIADGDYSITVPIRCDVDVMNKSINAMVDKTNETMGEIRSATEQVSSGSSQIADGAQLLAQGATEQSATVEQLSASIQEIAEQTKSNAIVAGEARDLSESIKSNAEQGSSQMEQMMQAVEEINESSKSIGKVIKIIDDIAFQTNILALNAAVEAARAGQHGKGFAVVADEVRSLAAKSAEAARNTNELIESSITKAEQGAAISTETAASLEQIVQGIMRTSDLVTEIAKSSDAQAIGINQISEAIGQVSQVVQQNSATAEESAAASEEMSGQAALLRQLIAQFRLKSTGMPGGPGAIPVNRATAAPPETGFSMADKY